MTGPLFIKEKRFGFGPRDRLRLRREIDAVFEGGRKVVASDVIVWHRLRTGAEAGTGERPRLAVVVSRKLGGAVRRNRIKRLVREVFRLHKGELARRMDVIVYPRPGCKWSGREDAEQALKAVWERAKIWGRR